MSKIRFELFDRSKTRCRIKVNENQTIAEIMDQFFPTSKKYTLAMHISNEVYVVKRGEKIKEILRKGILTNQEIEYHLINVVDFIDVYLNFHMRTVFITQKIGQRIYCAEDTQVYKVEEELSKIFGFELGTCGLYGYINKGEEKNIFKLRPNEYVLFLKRVFPERNFFQLQFKECKLSLTKLVPSYEAKFFRLDNIEQGTLFKKQHIYSLRETTLIKMKGDKIADCFKDVHLASITFDKVFAKNIIILQNECKKWILCSRNADIVQKLHSTLMICHKNRKSREVVDGKIEDDEISETNSSLTKKEIEDEKMDLENHDFYKNYENENLSFYDSTKESEFENLKINEINNSDSFSISDYCKKK